MSKQLEIAGFNFPEQFELIEENGEIAVAWNEDRTKCAIIHRDTAEMVLNGELTDENGNEYQVVNRGTFESKKGEYEKYVAAFYSPKKPVTWDFLQ